MKFKVNGHEVFASTGGRPLDKNKPLIVKKQRTRIARKSNYYSDRDINYARQAISFMEKSNWRDARKVAKKARAKSIYEFIHKHTSFSIIYIYLSNI